MRHVNLIQKLTPNCFLKLLKLRPPCFLQYLNWSTIDCAICVLLKSFITKTYFPSFTTRQRWQNGNRVQFREHFEEQLLQEGRTQQRKVYQSSTRTKMANHFEKKKKIKKFEKILTSGGFVPWTFKNLRLISFRKQINLKKIDLAYRVECRCNLFLYEIFLFKILTVHCNNCNFGLEIRFF